MNNDVATILAIETFLQENVIKVDGTNYYKDTSVAELYGIELEELHKIVNINPARFPSDFFKILPNNDKVFSYAGVLMLGGQLKSKRAIRFQIKLVEYFAKSLNDKMGISMFDLLANINREEKNNS